MLAAHVLGFSITDAVGYYGVERFYNVSLRPVTARARTLVDVLSDPVLWETGPITTPHAGDELHLTLDREIQLLAERELFRALDEFEAEAGTIIVMDPRTFELLAVASSPAYDPEQFLDYTHMEHPPFEDPAVSQQYEPGSVFKVLTVAAAIDAGLVSPDTVYVDNGFIEVGGRVIRNATRRAYGAQTVRELLVKSLNVGAAWLSTSMGPDTFYRYLQAFGIGRPTGTDLAGEISGQLWLPGDVEHYHDSNLGTNSFGQGLAVTPIQMISAIATVANDGARLRPHVGSYTIGHDGTVYRYRPVTEAQVISPETARLVTDMMVSVVEDGAEKAQVPGYRVAGKTGTAEIPIPGGYDPEGTIASFVGFGPVPDPQVVILVRLDRPQTSPWGSQTATVSFQRLASQLFVMLGIPPQQDLLAEVQS
jgi:cell division protein FtsI/penicillin-binding protein 2